MHKMCFQASILKMDSHATIIKHILSYIHLHKNSNSFLSSLRKIVNQNKWRYSGKMGFNFFAQEHLERRLIVLFPDLCRLSL